MLCACSTGKWGILGACHLSVCESSLTPYEKIGGCGLMKNFCLKFLLEGARSVSFVDMSTQLLEGG